MNFTRKKIRGQNQKVRRTWLSEENYRIIWRCEAFGIAVPPDFQATVRVLLPDGREMWDFVGRRLFKTLKAAQEACEKHQRLWTRAAEATGIRKLEELFGKVPFGYPVWVKSRLNRNVFGLLMDTTTRKRKDIEICDLDQDALTRISASFASSTEATSADPILASIAVEKEPSPTPNMMTTQLSAQPAKEPTKERRKRVVPLTSTPLKRTGRKRSGTIATSTTDAKPSRSSPKRKSNRSRS